MKLIHTPLAGLYILEDDPKSDDRGTFTEIFKHLHFFHSGIESTVTGVNVSESVKVGTFRGLHWQEEPFCQTKVIRCIRGLFYDVVVDVRKDSPTFGKSFGVTLNDDSHKSLYVPEGFAHGWQALSRGARLLYIVGKNAWTPRAERGIRFDDPKLSIRFPCPVTEVSDRDRSWPLL